MRHRFDFKHQYLTTFDDCNGDYFRTGIIDANGIDTGVEPFMSDFPHLLDIGIKGHCEHGLSGKCLEAGVYCYQKGGITQAPDMSLTDYISLMKQCKDKVFQVALGGRGDPDCHKDYEAILSATRNVGIVPNITTSGFLFDEEKARITKKYIGAGAVSWYKTDYTYKAIDLMLNEGITTNIHFILSQASIKEAVDLLATDGFPKGIKAVVFLLYKPVGYDKQSLVLKKDNPYLSTFFDYMNSDDQSFKMGFDSCLTPGVVNYCKDAAPECIEPCESGRFSAYISSDLTMYPCSFIQKANYGGDLHKSSIASIWHSESFDQFRAIQEGACPTCPQRDLCLGGCPDLYEITLCNHIERTVLR